MSRLTCPPMVAEVVLSSATSVLSSATSVLSSATSVLSSATSVLSSAMSVSSLSRRRSTSSLCSPGHLDELGELGLVLSELSGELDELFGEDVAAEGVPEGGVPLHRVEDVLEGVDGGGHGCFYPLELQVILSLGKSGGIQPAPLLIAGRSGLASGHIDDLCRG